MSPVDEMALRQALEDLGDYLLTIARSASEGTAGTPDRLYSIDQTCEILGCGRSLIYSEFAAGRLTSLKVGRRRLIPRSAIAQYVRDGGGR